MKPYADIDFYLTEYGSDNIPSSLFDKYILKASYKIKELTLGKSDLFVESKEVKNENGFSHGLQFVTWVGDGQCFIVKDTDGSEYRIRVSKEME